MVAISRPHLTQTATNVVHRARAASAPIVEVRADARREVSLKAWLCAEAFSARGWVLDLSEDGARLGGVGFRFTKGEAVMLKVELEAHAAPLVLKGEVVRADPVCVRFTHGSLEDHVRLAHFLDRLH